MVSTRKILSAALLLLAVALSGCADDGGDEAEPTTTETPTDTMTATGTTSPEPAARAPFYINGTVTGAIDCILQSNGAPTQAGSQQSLPADAANATYTLEIVTDPNPSASYCLVFNDGTKGNSGTVPAGATSFTLYADGAVQASSYSVRIDYPAA